MKIRKRFVVPLALLFPLSVHPEAMALDGAVPLEYGAIPIKRRMSYERYSQVKEIKEAVETARQSCRVLIDDIGDDRRNKKTIGTLAYKPLLVSQADKWLKDIHNHIIEKNLDNVPPEQAIVRLKPELTHLYTYITAGNINAVSALRTGVYSKGRLIGTRHYRGIEIKELAGNHVDEHHEALDRSIEHALVSLLKDIPKLCSSVDTP